MYDFSEVRKYYNYHFPDGKLEQRQLSVNIVLHVNFGNGVIILSFCAVRGVTSCLHSYESHRQGREVLKDRHSPLKLSVPSWV